MTFALPIKFGTATPLQLAVAGLGICPTCHAKTLALKYSGGGLDWQQCFRCLRVFALEKQLPKLPRPLIDEQKPGAAYVVIRIGIDQQIAEHPVDLLVDYLESQGLELDQRAVDEARNYCEEPVVK